MRKFERRFNFVFVLASIIIGFAFVMTIATYIGGAVVGYKLYTQIEQEGLNSVIERVWEGQDD